MTIEFDRRQQVEKDRVLWQKCVGVARHQLRTAPNNEGKLVAVEGIRIARCKLRGIEDLLRQIDTVLKPRPSRPQPDRKRNKRLQDQEIRSLMKGVKRSDDSHGHGSKKRQKR